MRAAATPYAVKVHGSELEYAIRGRPRARRRWPGRARRRSGGRSPGSEHIVSVTEELLGRRAPTGERMRIVPPGVDTDGFAPGRGSLAALRRLLDGEAGAESRPSAERIADPGAAAGSRASAASSSTSASSCARRASTCCSRPGGEIGAAHPGVGLVVVGFGDARAELEAAAPAGVVFTGAMDHAQLQRLVPLAEAVVVPSVLPEAFGMVAAEAAACEVVPIVADHSGLAEVAAGLGEAGITFDGERRPGPAAGRGCLTWPPERAGAAGRPRPRSRGGPLELGGDRPAPARRRLA